MPQYKLGGTAAHLHSGCETKLTEFAAETDAVLERVGEVDQDIDQLQHRALAVVGVVVVASVCGGQEGAHHIIHANQKEE